MSKTILLLGVLFGIMSIGGLVFDNAFAAVDMFVKYEGVDGESKDKDHDKWIDVLSFEWGITQSTDSEGKRSGPPSISEITITHEVSDATPQLLEHIADDRNFPKITIEICRSNDNAECYLQYEMEDVLISSYQMATSIDEDRMTETITLNFDKVDVKYTPYKKGKAQEPIISSWEVEDRGSVQ